MTYRNILVPTDGSERGREAVQRALDLAKAFGGRITGLYVVDTAAFTGASAALEWQALAEAMRSEGARALGEMAEMARTAGVPVETRVAEGHPAHEIIEQAAEHDLIVMATLGRSGLSHLLLGSVAERVIRHAPCPVLVIRVPGR